jgi:hypothetical protein
MDNGYGYANFQILIVPLPLSEPVTFTGTMLWNSKKKIGHF